MKKTLRVAVLILFAAIVSPVVAVLAGVDDEVNKIVGRQNEIYFNNQPIPLYDYSAQRDLVIQLYNATVPRMPNTWTVFYEMGTATDSCPSKGFGIPYGVSLTSPDYAKGNAAGSVLPQPEPTGLYTNDLSTSATWVFCVRPDGLVEPVYAEGNVRIYTHEVRIGANNAIEHHYDTSTIWMDMTKAGS